MHPPQWVVDRLEEIHPWVRLGWIGRKRAAPGELNPGYFALVQLYSARDSARTFLTPWDDRGPIFGSKFDRLQRTPIYVIDVEPEDVFSGKVIALLREWIKPIKQRIEESEAEQNSAVNAHLNDTSESVADHMAWRANQTDATRPEPVPKKFLTKEEKNLLTGDYDSSIDLSVNADPDHTAAIS